MPTLPSEFLTVILPYASLFCKRVFVHVQLLMAGTVLAPGKRTISSVLRIVGLHQEKAFHNRAAGAVSSSIKPCPMVGYFVRRWSIKTTFALVRAHLGVETQRQWSDLSIGRTTPVLLGLFSLVTLVANSLHQQDLLTCQMSSWYIKKELTFSDALAGVRRYLWQEMNFCTSEKEVVYVKMSQQQRLPQQYQLWQNALAWAA